MDNFKKTTKLLNILHVKQPVADVITISIPMGMTIFIHLNIYSALLFVPGIMLRTEVKVISDKYLTYDKLISHLNVSNLIIHFL